MDITEIDLTPLYEKIRDYLGISDITFKDNHFSSNDFDGVHSYSNNITSTRILGLINPRIIIYATSPYTNDELTVSCAINNLFFERPFGMALYSHGKWHFDENVLEIHGNLS